MKTLTARVGHTYNNKWRKPGDEYTARDMDAVILVGIKKAVYSSARAVVAVADDVKPAASADVEALRDEYAELFGKKPHWKLSADKIAAEIAEKKGN